MKTLLALLAAPLLAAPSVPTHNPVTEHGPIFAGRPPERFMREQGGIILFVGDVTQMCGPAPAGYTKYGCAFENDNGIPVMVVPHPCLVVGDFYADLLCHEQGHWAGWSGNHEIS